jgi:hypothetical protein
MRGRTKCSQFELWENSKIFAPQFKFFSLLTAELNTVLLVAIPKFVPAQLIICVTSVGKFEIVLSATEINAVSPLFAIPKFSFSRLDQIQFLFAIPKFLAALRTKCSHFELFSLAIPKIFAADRTK